MWLAPGSAKEERVRLKIVMLSRHGCFRCMKEAIPLINAGHEVHFIVEKFTQYAEEFATVSLYADQDQLYNAIRLHKDADIFHAHNEPSWFVTVVKDTGVKAPVILDMHDSNLIRKTPEEQVTEMEHNESAVRISVDERNNAQLADGLVFPCEPMKAAVEAEFGTTCPSIVLPSLLPKAFFRFDFDHWLGGLVYEGRIDTNEELNHQPQWKSLFQYSNYLDFARKAREIGIPFHIYTPRENEKVRAEYGEVCFLHQPKPIPKLIKALARHEWGLVGNLQAHTEWKNALPNKLFEYMAGCTPVVAMHADESAKVLKEYGVGIVVDSVEELRDRWDEHRACRENIVKYRYEFAMEKHIGKLEALYRQVIEAKRPMAAVSVLRDAKATSS